MDHDPPRMSWLDGDGQDVRQPLRVLFLDNSFTFGGAIISLKRLIDGLEDLGIEPRIISGQPQKVMHQQFGRERTVSARVRVPWRHNTELQKLLKSFTSGSQLLSTVASSVSSADWLLRRTLPDSFHYAWIGHKHDIDLIHLNNGLEGQIAGLLAAKYLGVPCVAHARGFQRPSRLVRMLAGMVDRHISISTSIDQNLLEIGVPDDQIVRINDAVNIEEYREEHDTRRLRRQLGIPESSRVFGYVGRMVEWKGVKEFVAAAIRVLRRQREAVALVVGDESDGHRSYFRDVRDLARGSPVSDRIVFTGYREDIPAIMNTLDVLVHTSLAPEPFGLVLVEAMAAGKPVVAADRGGPLDIVLDGNTGFLVDPEDIDGVAESIRRLITNANLAERMGRAGQRRAETNFSVDRYARGVAAVYREVTS